MPPTLIPPHPCYRASLRLPDGSLSPAAFQPVPRSATPSMAGTGTGYALPAEEQAVKFGLLYEQQWEPGRDGEAVPPAAACPRRHLSVPPCPAGSVPDEGHVATDESGDLLLSLMSHTAQRLYALRLTGTGAVGSIEPAFSLPAASVAAVVATRGISGLAPADRPRDASAPLRDLLVLHPNGVLSLHVGQRCVCNVSPPAKGIRLAYTLHDLRSAWPATAKAPDYAGLQGTERSSHTGK